MNSKDIVLVTGANTGLGYEIIKALSGSDKPYHILLGGRSLSKVQQAISSAKEEFPSSSSELSPIQIDIEDDESIQKAFDEVYAKHGRLDALINNAGAQFDQQLNSGRMTMREVWNHSWNVNTTGTQIITTIFVPLLLQSNNPRLLFITSGTSTLTEADNQAIVVNRSPPKGWPKNQFGVPAYRSSKTGMNMMMREWYRLLQADGVKVWCISPGMLATGLGGDQQANKARGAGDPAEGGKFVQTVVEGQRDGDVGQVILRDRVQPW